MNAVIKKILDNSIAQRLGLVPGDRVVAVNGNDRLEDLFDYQFEVTTESEVVLRVEHANGSVAEYGITKDEWEDLGIEFESPIFTPIKTCNNACPFCFIDQQPQGLRASLYVKDDDYRLSYFCNTYITLTNLTRHDRERIERIRPGPLYVSVHSTVPEVRQQLLLNPKAGEIMTELRWLAGLEIPFHAQVVVCPGLNDGDSLSQTLRDLATLRPHCLSVAVVPVGLTAYRDGLPGLTPVSKTVALEVLRRIEDFESETGCREFVFASDEFFVRAELPIPGYDAYGDFPQLDDGVGTARLLTEEFYALEPMLPEAISSPRRYIILTGQLGAMVLQPIVQRLNRVRGMFVDLVAVENQFWGEAVTVSGLITGQDIMASLGSQDLSGYDAVLIPETMIKAGADLFLDGYRIADVAQQIGCAIQVVSNPSRAASLLNMLFKETGLQLAAD